MASEEEQQSLGAAGLYRTTMPMIAHYYELMATITNNHHMMHHKHCTPIIHKYLYFNIRTTKEYLLYLIEIIVQMIMETMSDSVSQLVLLVITLQEQNAALPPGLPPAAVRI